MAIIGFRSGGSTEPGALGSWASGGPYLDGVPGSPK